MTLKEYKDLAMRTNDGKCTERLLLSAKDNVVDVGGVINACLGLPGEVGEVCDTVKKGYFPRTYTQHRRFKKRNR